MDATQTTIVIGLGLILGSAILSYLMVHFPQTRAWIRKKAVEGYNYLDSIKKDVPAEAMPTWQAAYDGLDAVIDAFGDDELTASELRHIAMHALELVMSVKKMVA